MYYEANEGRLFMGQSTAADLPAPNLDAFDEVPLTGSITPPAYVRSTAYFNVTNDAQRRSLGGKIGDQTIEGNVVIDWDDPTHNAMFADARASSAVKRNWYIDYAGGRRLDFRGFVSSFTEEALEASDDAKEHRANWAIAVDGGVTVTPAAP